MRPTRLALAALAVPIVALTVGVPFANRLEPRVFGLPFLLAYLIAGIVVAPAFVGLAYAIDRRHGRHRA